MQNHNFLKKAALTKCQKFGGKVEERGKMSTGFGSCSVAAALVAYGDGWNKSGHILHFIIYENWMKEME